MEDTTRPEQTGLAVDLTREEYIGYHLLLTRISSPVSMRAVQVLLSLLCGAALLLTGIYSWLAREAVEWDILALSAAVLVLTVISRIAAPARMKKRAGALYDESIDSGYSYYGYLQVYPDRIEKVGKEFTTTIPVQEDTLFVESPEYMVWINREQRAIVLPARCMTAQAAADVRRAADRLPARNRRFFGRLAAQGQPAQPPQEIAYTVLWEQTLEYTPEEYRAQMRYMATQRYRRRLPMLGIISAAMGLLLGWSDTAIWPCVPWFLAIFAVLTLLNWGIPLRRYAAAADALPRQARQLWVSFSDRGMRMRQDTRYATIPWRAFNHIIDRGDYVELLRREQSVRIPKRCIDDLPAFDAMITHYWHNKK